MMPQFRSRSRAGGRGILAAALSWCAALACWVGEAAVAQAAPPPPVAAPAKAPVVSKPAPDRPTGDQAAIDGDPKARAEAIAKPQPHAGERDVQVTASVVVKVIHPAEVRKATIEHVKSKGGWPLLVTNQELHLAVPLAALATVVDQVAASGIVLQKTLQRVDRTDEIVQLRAKLKSKREILARLRGLLDDADTNSTLRVEATMNQLVGEVEQLQGDLNVATASVQSARVMVSFQYHQRQRITYVNSPFQWLNRLDINRFLADF